MQRAVDRPTLLHVFSTFAIGGPQTRFAVIANALGIHWRHRVLSLDGRTQAKELLHHEIDFELVEDPGHKGQALRNVARAIAFLRRTRPALLITYNWGAVEWALAARLLNYPHLHVADGFGPEEADGQLPRRVQARRIALGGQTRVLVPSRTLLTAAAAWRVPRARLRYVPNGIDVARFVPAEHASSTPVRVGALCPLRAEKNVGRLLDAFAAAARTHARLDIWGDGPERPMLEARATALGIADRTTFHGHVSDPAPALAQLDLFAITSDTEQMPMALLEAMATGLPVAATDVGDIASMLSDANRPFVVSKHDMVALAGALATLIDDGALRTQLGSANRAKVARDFTLQQMVDGWEELWRSFAAKAGRQPAASAAHLEG
ncbi:glycosyltransferase [Roseiterribacter gracilis]|uniref:Glycosyl transferase family 1 n=1 Tax=Roseiterribacter gracilis TaxID=2812848 RepID=A0A8S8X6A9_9PROT|nr:glycosyl transferase family 1 [Rhodospirillales bacterium TMPK1]